MLNRTKQIILISSICLVSVAVIITFFIRAPYKSNFEIISKSFSTALEGTDRIVYVHTNVRNNGSPANATVYSKVVQYGGVTGTGVSGAWLDCQTIYLASNESRGLTFKFTIHQVWPRQWSPSHPPSGVSPSGRNDISWDVWIVDN